MYANKVTDVKSFMCNFDNRIKTLSACERETKKKKERKTVESAGYNNNTNTHSQYVCSEHQLVVVWA